MSSDYLSQMPGLTNPITHAGRVVYNAQRDYTETHKRRGRKPTGATQLYTENEQHDENHSIQPYEICIRNTKNNMRSGRPTDTDIWCFSSLNGVYTSEKWDGTETDKNLAAWQTKQLHKKRDEDYVFAGIACNRAIYDPDNNANEAMLAVQVGGLQTMYNTGTHRIEAGMVVVWGVPASDAIQHRKKIPGIRHNKILFTTEPHEEALEAALTAMQKLNSSLTPDEQRTEPQMGRSVNMRVMGKAMSSADAGKPFDILLGHYCA